MSPTIQQREKMLRDYRAAYELGEPEVSDAVYDALMLEHTASRHLYPDDPTWKNTVLDQVGSPEAGKRRKVKHDTPMLSLANVFIKPDEEDPNEQVKSWLQTFDESTYVIVEPKIDGAGVNLIYEKGELVEAVTRGDGSIGEDVLANVLAAELVKPSLSVAFLRAIPRLELRGEVFIHTTAFDAMNNLLKEAGEPLMANPRNAAAGIMRRSNPEECVGKGLCLAIHSPVIDLTCGQDFADEFLDVLRAAKLPVVPGFHVRADKLVADFLEAGSPANLQSWANAYGIPVDGAVIKLSSLHRRAELGFTSTSPRWAVAVKFPQPEVTTRLTAITVQVGRSGVLTPVAELEPVLLDGSVVRRATLHNEEQVNRLGISEGDTVVVRKAAAIIPEVVGRAEGVPARTSPFSLAAHVGFKCPSCGTADLQVETTINGKRYACNNPFCVEKIAARVFHIAGRACLDITGIGEEMAKVIAERIVNFDRLALLYRFPQLVRDAAGWPDASWTTGSGTTMTFGLARATKAVEAAVAAERLPMHRWLCSLGIPSIGVNTSKEIARLFRDPGELEGCVTGNGTLPAQAIYAIALDANAKDRPEFAELQINPNNLGPVSCEALVQFLSSRVGKEAMVYWKIIGVTSDNYAPVRAVGKLTGKTFAITGTLSEPRDVIKARIEASGGKVSGSISAKLTALICGEGGGSKRDKASKAGVPVWSEDDLNREL